MTTLQRLISYPHAAVFDKAPASVLVFRLRHDEVATWVIADGVMTARAGNTTSVHQLADVTLTQLAAALTADGFDVIGLLSEYGAYSALVLIEGSGDQGVSNGDHVMAYTSLMWVFMGGYGVVLREAAAQVIQALRQMIITQAEGEWLDLWGMLYNERRRQGESDATYAPRIPKEAFRLRENPIAIEEAVKDATGKTIRIEEPWGDIFRLDHSTLSGPDKFQDGSRIGYFFIQPTSTTPLDWSDVLPVIERNRAAGVMVLPPFARNHSHIDANIVGLVEFCGTSVHSRHQRYEDRTLLDFSNIEDFPILNHPARCRREVRHLSYSSALGWLEAPWPNIPWQDGSYYVEGQHYRSYRVYYLDLKYESQYWPDLPWLEEAWADVNALIATHHTRS